MSTVRDDHRRLVNQLCHAVRMKERADECHDKEKSKKYVDETRRIKGELAEIIYCFCT